VSIQSVLTLVDGGAHTDCALRAAIAVGTAFDAHVEVLRIESPFEPLVSALPDGGNGAALLAEDWEREVGTRTASAKSCFDNLCSGAGLAVVEPDAPPTQNGATFAWRLVAGHENPELARRGRLVDLVVMARADEDEGGVDSAALEAALFDTGRPVLIVGEGNELNCRGRLAIAWDGSREAAHSVGLALPVLQSADDVVVLRVVDGDGEDDTEALRHYLKRHGIGAEAVLVRRGERPIAEALRDEVASRGIDMVVMGAYGHSAISEFFFGGVTRDMLKAFQVPLFLAH